MLKLFPTDSFCALGCAWLPSNVRRFWPNHFDWMDGHHRSDTIVILKALVPPTTFSASNFRCLVMVLSCNIS